MDDHSDAPIGAASPTDRVRGCGSYTPGHDVHYIQTRVSRAAGERRAARIDAVHDDGTITLADGTTLWNHDPTRLRGLLARHGSDVWLGAHGVMRLSRHGGDYCFCVASEATPCPAPAAPPDSLEDVVRQAAERGGFMISGQQLLRLVDEKRR
jgi:hypothetical protein